MESEGIPDKIKVSYSTKELLDKIPGINARFERQEDVDVSKLNKMIENYIVERID